MKNTNKEKLINFIKRLTPEQAEKLVMVGMPLMRKIKKMGVNQIIFADVFLGKILFGEKAGE